MSTEPENPSDGAIERMPDDELHENEQTENEPAEANTLAKTAAFVRSKRILLGSLLVMTFLMSVCADFLYYYYPDFEESSPGRTFRLIYSLAGSALLVGWFHVDAREHNYVMPKSQAILLFVLMPLAAPGYFIRSRTGSAWPPIGRAILFVGLWAVVGYLGSLCAYGLSLAHYNWTAPQ